MMALWKTIQDERKSMESAEKCKLRKEVFFDKDALHARIERMLGHSHDMVVSPDFDKRCEDIADDYWKCREAFLAARKDFASEKSKFEKEWLA